MNQSFTSKPVTPDSIAAKKKQPKVTFDVSHSMSDDGRFVHLQHKSNAKFRSYQVNRTTPGEVPKEEIVYDGADLPREGVLKVGLTQAELDGKVNCSYSVSVQIPYGVGMIDETPDAEPTA